MDKRLLNECLICVDKWKRAIKLKPYSSFRVFNVDLTSNYVAESVTLLPSGGVESRPLAVRLSGITLSNNAEFRCCDEVVKFPCH